MPSAAVNGIQVFYEDQHGGGGEPMVLVTGFTAQLTSWPAPLIEGLIERGFRVIRLDNRDSGLSTHLDGVNVNPFEVDPAKVPYLLSDMAGDVIGLLDHLGIERVHLVGASMGGMIVQTLALDHPERVRSLCSIMSTTGGPGVGQPTAEAITALLVAPPADRDGVMARSVSVAAVIGSKTHPGVEEEIRARAGLSYDRAYYPEGSSRQLAAMLASGDRTERLAGITVPTVVIHGMQDTLIQPDGGRATMAAIPGAELVELADMGHDLPAHLVPQLADIIEGNARRAGA